MELGESHLRSRSGTLNFSHPPLKKIEGMRNTRPIPPPFPPPPANPWQNNDIHETIIPRKKTRFSQLPHRRGNGESFATKTASETFVLFRLPHLVEHFNYLPVQRHGDRYLARDAGEPGRHASVESTDPLVLQHITSARERGRVLRRVQALHTALHHIDTLYSTTHQAAGGEADGRAGGRERGESRSFSTVADGYLLEHTPDH